MGRASIPTKLSLGRWAYWMGIHPLHFSQVQVANLAPATGCQQPWLQHSWQAADRMGREELAMAIVTAENNIETQLGYRLLPSWEEDEWRATVRPYDPTLVNISGATARGYRQIVKGKWGHFITGGVETKTLVQAGVVIVVTDPTTPLPADGWKDLDGGGYYETGTVIVATTVTDPCEIAIYYPGKSGANEWEIRAVSVSIAAGMATITFRREDAVREVKQEEMGAKAVDGALPTPPALDDNFLLTVDVYRHWNDPQTQVTMMWEPTGSCDCGSTTCPQCAYAVQAGCLHLRGEPIGSLIAYSPATWDAAAQAFYSMEWSVGRLPDIVKLYYLAGLGGRADCPRRSMDWLWEKTVADYAAALMERPICDCATASDRVTKAQADLAFSGGASELSSYNLSSSDLDNPFGTRRGAVMAWKQVKQHAAGRVVHA